MKVILPRYDPPPKEGRLLQGEVLGGIWEHRPLYPAVEIPEGTDIDTESMCHPLMIVMNPVCDLQQDFNARFPEGLAREPQQYRDLPNQAIVPHVLLCDVYIEKEMRPLIKGSDIWKRIEQNQDERYHHIEPAPIGDPRQRELPAIYLDFKKTIGIPCAGLYEGIRQNGIERIAVVPPVYVHDLIQRFYSFLARVGVPEFKGNTSEGSPSLKAV